MTWYSQNPEDEPDAAPGAEPARPAQDPGTPGEQPENSVWQVDPPPNDPGAWSPGTARPGTGRPGRPGRKNLALTAVLAAGLVVGGGWAAKLATDSDASSARAAASQGQPGGGYLAGPGQGGQGGPGFGGRHRDDDGVSSGQDATSQDGTSQDGTSQDGSAGALGGGPGRVTGELHVLGTVASVSGSGITVKVQDGTSVSCAVETGTLVAVNGSRATIADVSTGQTALVAAIPQSDGSCVAEMVLVGSDLGPVGSGGHGGQAPGSGDDSSNGGPPGLTT